MIPPREQFTGQWAHLLQRATGIMLLGYLLLHVKTIQSLSGGAEAFNAAIATFKSPLFKLAEIALLGVVVLHAFNGIRVTLLDLGYAQSRQRQLFWIWSIAIAALVLLAGAIPLFLSGVMKAR